MTFCFRFPLFRIFESKVNSLGTQAAHTQISHPFARASIRVHAYTRFVGNSYPGMDWTLDNTRKRLFGQGYFCTRKRKRKRSHSRHDVGSENKLL